MKNKLYLIAAASCGLFTAGISMADESTTIDLSYSSDYVFRGIQFGEDTIHPSIEVAIDDLYIGVWGALSQTNKGWPNSYEDEYDFYIGQSYALNESVVVDGGVTLYTYEDSDESLELYLGASKELNGLTGSAYVYYDFDLETTTLEFSGSHSYALTDAINVDFGVYFGTVFSGEEYSDDGLVLIEDDYSYYGADTVSYTHLTLPTNREV